MKWKTEILSATEVCVHGFFFFPLMCEDWGEGLIKHSKPVFFVCVFSKWRLAGEDPFHSLPQDQSTVAQQVEMTADEHSLTSCMWWVLPLCPDSTVSPLWLCKVEGVCVFSYNLPPTFLAEWPQYVICHCTKKAVEQTYNENQHRLILEKKILLLLLPEIELVTIWSWVWHSTNWAISLPIEWCTLKVSWQQKNYFANSVEILPT